MFDLNVTTAVVGNSLITTVGSGAAVGVGSGGAGAAVGTGAGVGTRGTPEFRWCATYQAPPPTARRTTAARKTFRAEPPPSRAGGRQTHGAPRPGGSLSGPSRPLRVR